MSERFKKILILVAIVAAIIIIIWLLWWLWGKKAPVIPSPIQPPSVEQPATNTIANLLPPANPQTQNQEATYPLGLKQVAFNFAERFGSYSTDLKFKNLYDLMPQMTDKMAAATRQLIARNAAVASNFEAYATTALSSDLLYYDKDRATVLVKTQRTYASGADQAKIFIQNVLLKLIKVKEQWKIDEATWDKI